MNETRVLGNPQSSLRAALRALPLICALVCAGCGSEPKAGIENMSAQDLNAMGQHVRGMHQALKRQQAPAPPITSSGKKVSEAGPP